MGKDNLEQIFSSKLDNRSPNMDYENLWAELEPRLPRKKNKNKWWLLLLPLMGLLIGIGYIMISDNPLDNKNHQTSQVIETNNNKTKNRIPSNDNRTTDQNEIKEKNVEIEEIKTNDPPPKNSHPKSDFILNKTIPNGQQPQNTKENAKKTADKIPVDGFAKTTTSPEQNVSTSGQSSPIAIANNSNNNEEEVIAGSVDKSTTNSSTVSPVDVLTGSNDVLRINSIPGVQLSNLLYTDNIPENPMDIASVPTNKNYAIGHSISFSTSALYGQSTFQNTFDYDETYIMDLSSSLTSLFGYGVSLGYTMSSTTGIYAGVDISYNKLYQKFELHNEVTEVATVFNDSAFLYSGSFIGADQQAVITTKQDVLNYNSFMHIDLFPHVGYTLSGGWPLRVEAGPIINVSQKYDGKIIENRRIVLSDASNLYRTSNVLSGFQLGLGVSKSVTSNMSIDFDVNYKYRSSVESSTNELFGQRLTTYGLGIGVQYRL